MKKFAFKLEPLYDYRKRLEEISAKDFAVALKKLDDEEARLDALFESYRNSADELDRLKEDGAHPEDMNVYYAYFRGLRNHIEAQKRLVSELRGELEKKRQGLEKATNEKKVVENLKEKSYERYLKRAEKAEQKVNDDLASSRYKRGGAL